MKRGAREADCFGSAKGAFTHRPLIYDRDGGAESDNGLKYNASA